MNIIYTDGSSRGNPGPGGWGAIIITDNKVVEMGGGESHTTNNRMELTATIRALEFISHLPADGWLLHTDSEYVMKGITLWIKSWQAKGWKTANRKPVLNQDLWQELLHLTQGRTLEWKYVPGHSGVSLNERADTIATTFADNLKTDLYDGPREQYRYL